MTEFVCQHINVPVYRCIVGAFTFWRCPECKANFTTAPVNPRPADFPAALDCKHNAIIRYPKCEYWDCVACDQTFTLAPAEIRVLYPVYYPNPPAA